MLAKSLKFGRAESTKEGVVSRDGMTYLEDMLTLQLKCYTFTSSDDSTGLPHPFQRKRNFFLINARNAISNQVHIIALRQQVKARYQNANMRLDKAMT